MKLLIAEHREIKRIPNCVKTGRVKINEIPDKFTLGKGHVKFFYNKIKYLEDRYNSIYEECINRNYNVQYYGESFAGIKTELMNNYIETPEDRALLVERITGKGFNLIQS